MVLAEFPAVVNVFSVKNNWPTVLSFK